MSTQPPGQPALPPGPTPLAEIIAESIAQAHRVADGFNTSAVSLYNSAKRNAAQQNETMPPNLPQIPAPIPPMLVMVNEAEIAAAETADNSDFANAWIWYRYVDPVPPPTIPDTGTITLDLAHPVAPGLFRVATGNVHFLSAGYTLNYSDGHEYQLQFTLLGPLFQQIS